MEFQEQDRQEVIKALDELTAEGYWEKLDEASKQPGFSEDPVVVPSNDNTPIAASAGRSVPVLSSAPVDSAVDRSAEDNK